MPYSSITGVILSGGRASRMCGIDKGLLELAGKPLVEHVSARLAPQVVKLLINANRNIERYASMGYVVVQDDFTDYSGPLAGMLSTLCAADTEYILTAPCDCPYIPLDFAERMMASLMRDNAMLCVACDGNRIQPVFALISRDLTDDIQACLAGGQHKVETCLMAFKPAIADFSDQPLAFMNINTLHEHAVLETKMKLAKHAK